jgi:hypothetical protein
LALHSTRYILKFNDCILYLLLVQGLATSRILYPHVSGNYTLYRLCISSMLNTLVQSEPPDTSRYTSAPGGWTCIWGSGHPLGGTRTAMIIMSETEYYSGSSWFWTAIFYVSEWRIAVGGDSSASMPSFACRGRVRPLAYLLCMLGAVFILQWVETALRACPALYAGVG